MTDPSVPGQVIPFWPVWTRSLDAMIRRLARARSRCRRCGTLLHAELDALHRRLGGSASLIDRTAPCAVVGCGGTIYYLAAPATGAAYHVLVGDSALLGGVVDPIAIPFRSRWHDMVAIGPATLPFPTEAQIIAWPGTAC